RSALSKAQDRYLIPYPRRSEFYVQCSFHDDGRRAVCEAASGFYFEKIRSLTTKDKVDQDSSKKQGRFSYPVLAPARFRSMIATRRQHELHREFCGGRRFLR